MSADEIDNAVGMVKVVGLVVDVSGTDVGARLIVATLPTGAVGGEGKLGVLAAFAGFERLVVVSGVEEGGAAPGWDRIIKRGTVRCTVFPL